MRLSQKHRNLETREPGIRQEEGGQLQVTPGALLVGCREMMGRKEAGMGLSPSGMLLSWT